MYYIPTEIVEIFYILAQTLIIINIWIEKIPAS